MTEVEPRRNAKSREIVAGEARLANARVAFEAGLRDASAASGRALRKVVPVLCGAALVGGAVGVLLLVRYARRKNQKAVLRLTLDVPVVLELPVFERMLFGDEKPTEKPTAKPILTAIGGAVLRFAIERLMAGLHGFLLQSGPDPAVVPQLSSGGASSDGARGAVSRGAVSRGAVSRGALSPGAAPPGGRSRAPVLGTLESVPPGPGVERGPAPASNAESARSVALAEDVPGAVPVLRGRTPSVV
jgi:uncharacterized membrane protein YsdA (DUF1294 family)